MSKKISNSSFDGVIDEYPYIKVDNFENAEDKVEAYFLSHCHTDHTQGLYNPKLIEALERTNACIYMSVASAAIVNDETRDVRLMKFVRPLESLTETLVYLPKQYVYTDGEEQERDYLYVTLLPAAHCLGSVMFLFQTSKKTVLYTGDFRISTSDVERMPYYHKNGAPLKIDAMYVDTTFIDNKKYATFPKRSESIDIILDEINNHLRKHKENGRVALHTSAKYGYEFVFKQIEEKLGMKVYVDDSMWKVYSKIPDIEGKVTNSSDGVKIHNCRFRWTQNLDHSSCVPATATTNGQGSKLEYLYIHFSALAWTDFKVEGETFEIINANRINVCFATHCSSTELHHFVEYFNPRRVVGFPNKYTNRRSDEKWDTIVVSPKKRKVEVVKEVVKTQEKRVSRELLIKLFEF